MSDLKLVRELPGWGKGVAELYTLDGDYVVVSTVTLGAGADITERAMIQIGGVAGALLGKPVADLGEIETMAFRADEEGEVDNWAAIAVAHGEDSREAVLEELRNA